VKKRGGGTKGAKKPNRKKGNKTLSHKKTKWGKKRRKTDKKAIKVKKPKIKVLAHEIDNYYSF
jgi:hypothetical protein